MFENETIQEAEVIDETIDEAACVETVGETIDETADVEAEETVDATDDAATRTYSPDEVSNLIDGAIVVGAGIGVAATALTAAVAKVATPVVKKGFVKTKAWIDKRKKQRALEKAAIKKVREEQPAADQGNEEA